MKARNRKNEKMESGHPISLVKSFKMPCLAVALLMGCISKGENPKLEGEYRLHGVSAYYVLEITSGGNWKKYVQFEDAGRNTPASFGTLRNSNDSLYLTATSYYSSDTSTTLTPCTEACFQGVYIFMGDSLKYVLNGDGSNAGGHVFKRVK